jgi:glycosyltransferase involved in cell wall biosynthesis
MIFEPAEGGVAEVVTQLATRLGTHGVEVDLVGPLESPFYDRLDGANVPVRRLPVGPGLGEPLHDARMLRPLVAHLRRRTPDVVHCHSAKAGVLGRLAARRAGVPAIFSPHSWAFDVDYGGPRPLLTLAIERGLGRLTAGVLCVSEHERRVALRHRIVEPDRLHVVHNGCAACDGSVEPMPELLRLRAGGPLVAAVTGLRSQKSLEVLIEAAPRVWQRLPDARIAIVGNGPERERLRALASETGVAADPRFAMLPFKAPAARALRAIDVYVLPSAYEGFPIAVLEAQACGVPQVVTDVGGTPEAVTSETGIIVPPRDAAALADAISELLSDPDRRSAMSGASRVRQAEHFTLERMVAGVAGVYRAVLDRSGRSRGG